MTGTSVQVGAVKPGELATVGYAAQLTVNSSSPWSLQALAPAEFQTSVAPVKSMPIGRLEWRIHAFATAFTQFVSGLQTLLGAQPPTPPEGQTVVVDLRLAPQFSDLPSAADGSDPYRAAIVYSVTAGTIDSAYAWPNPFSPDGDGVNDRTAVHWYQGAARVVDVLVYTADGSTLVRTLTVASALGSGEQQLEWDGRDDARNLAGEGEYLFRVRVNPGEAVDPGLSLASGLIGLERGIGAGTAVVTGTVSSSQTGTLAGARVELHRAGGGLVASQLTDAAGVYTFTAVAAGTYYLEVSAALHFDWTSGNFEVTTGATVTLHVTLVHNNSLTISKLVDVPDAEPGDVVAYIVEVSTIGGVETVDEVVVHDDLPEGLRLVPGSARLEGSSVPGDSRGHATVLRGRRVTFPVGTIAPGKKVTLRYEAVVVGGTKPGVLTNTARATGMVLGTPVTAGPTSARVFVHDGDTGDRSLVFGRVFLDRNGDGVFGAGDKPLPGSRVVLDDGTLIVVDELGRWSVKGLRDGARTLMAVVNPAPQAATTVLVPTGPSKVRLVDVRFGAAANVDFAFTEDELGRAAGVEGAQTTLGVVDATIGLEFGRGDTLAILRLAGRAAFFIERDLGHGYRLSGSLDTRRDPRDELGIGRDPLSFQPEVGDESTLTPGPPDRIGARLRAPWGQVILGRTGVNFGASELISPLRSFVGLDVEFAGKRWAARAFLGGTDSLVRLEELENDGTTGPYQLGSIPLVPRTERAAVETRDATGRTIARQPLVPDTDYVLDYSTGQLFLAAPWPLLTPSGERYVFIIEYEYAPREELPVGVVTGARFDYRVSGNAAVGATFFSDDGDPDRRTAFGVDSRWRSDRLDIAGEAAISSEGTQLPGALPGDDPTALRVRSTYRPHDQVDLYGYLNRIGGGYGQRIDFRNRSPGAQSFGYLPPPSQSLITPPLVRSLFDGQREFPFILQSTQDRFEYGLGTLYRPRPDLDLSVGTYRSSNDLDDRAEIGENTYHTDYLTGRWHPKGWPEVFVATTGTSQSATDASQRSWILASKWEAGPIGLDAEYRLLDVDASGETPDTLGHAGLVRGRYRRWMKLQPAVLLEAGRATRDDCEGDCVVSRNVLLAVGLESTLRMLSLFVYGTVGEALDTTAAPEPTTYRGAFAGVNLATPRVAGTLRFDVSDDSLLGLQAGGGGRARLFVSRSITAFGSVNFKLGTDADPRAQWNHTFGLAYRPVVRPRFYAFLKYRDRSLPSLFDDGGPRRRNQLATADFIVPVTRALSLSTRGAWKQVRSGGGDVTMMIAAEEVTWHFWKRWDLIAGFRAASSSVGGELLFGGTVGAGLWFDQTFRLVLGLNYAAEDWAFEADDSIPGIFLNVTGVYGAAGAPAIFGY